MSPVQLAEMKNCLYFYHNLHKTNICVRSWDFCSGDSLCFGVLDFNTVFLPNLCTYQSQGLTGCSPTHLCYILHIPAASQPLQLDPVSDWLWNNNAWIGAYLAYQNTTLFGRWKPVNARCQARILVCMNIWLGKHRQTPAFPERCEYCLYRHSPCSAVCVCIISLRQWHEKSGWQFIYPMKSIVCWPPL